MPAGARCRKLDRSGGKPGRPGTAPESGRAPRPPQRPGIPGGRWAPCGRFLSAPCELFHRLPTCRRTPTGRSVARPRQVTPVQQDQRRSGPPAPPGTRLATASHGTQEERRTMTVYHQFGDPVCSRGGPTIESCSSPGGFSGTSVGQPFGPAHNIGSLRVLRLSSPHPQDNCSPALRPRHPLCAGRDRLPRTVRD